MINLSTYNGKNIALFGLGGSGMLCAHALVAGGARVTAYDDNPDSVARARERGLHCRDLRKCDFGEFDELVLAPGVPLTHPQPHWSVELAQNAKVPVVGDIALFCRERRSVAPGAILIAITGTNGKSTTTALITHVLKNAGRKVEMGGNIGRAVMDFDTLDNDTIYVVEVSSYQIDLAPEIDADIGLLLNLSPDHLDRHGTMERYAKIKTSLVQNADVAIISVDDAWCREAAAIAGGEGKQVTTISVHQKLDNGVFASGDKIFFAQNGVETLIADLENISSLRGFHNAQNACFAWEACRKAGLNNEQIQAGFASFPGLVDRMEILGTIGNILVVNDSKGTNADATDMALGSFDNIYWIAGGLAKEGGIEPLRHHFSRISRAYLIGEAAALFAGTLGESVEYVISQTLDKALRHAVADARCSKDKEPVILMSPACASFDQFPNYAVRGKRFREIVAQVDDFKARKNS